MKKHFAWLNNYGLLVIALFLLAFIPLYPKLPLIDVVQTWVSIRFEDLLVAIGVGALLVVLLKDRKMTDNPLLMPVAVYWGIGFISMANALIWIFPANQGSLFPHLAWLHMFRRIEYMSVIFLGYEAYKRVKKISPVLWTIAITYLLVIAYGFGQKFLGFPAFMTMNEEFAKGIPLRLPSTARMPSTFGGHYDLGAYLVFMIPIIGSITFGVKKWWMKVLCIIAAALGLVMLLFTASRISFGMYIVGVSAMLTWHKKPLYIIPVLLTSFLLLNGVSGAADRFYKTFRVSNVVVDLSTGKPIGTLDKLEGRNATLEKIESPAEESLPKGSEFINLPSQDADQNQQGQIKKVEYYKTQGLKADKGEIATASGSFLVQKALVYDISITTRFQGQWPKAIKAWKRNIFLGSGFSSLSVAVDGDYHRMLGETGILGSLAFLGIFIASFALFFKRKHDTTGLEKSFVIGVFGGIVGLLCNATLIDVFEASKVAFTLYIILGMALAVLVGSKKVDFSYFNTMKRFLTHKVALVVYLLLLILYVWWDVMSMYFIGDDFTWLRWAAESSTQDIGRYFSSAQGFFYRPIPKVWYFITFSVFWLKPTFHHLSSLMLYGVTVVILYGIMMKLQVRRWITWTITGLCAVLAVHHENIFWISGQSSLLSGLFMMIAIYWSIGVEVIKKNLWKYITYVGIITMCALSMLSYDGMLVSPLILILIAGWKGNKKQWWWIALLLLLIPAYWWIRSVSGAINPSGNYGYKWKTFAINFMGNGLGYSASFFIGPRVMEWWEQVRVAMKIYLVPMSGIGTLMIVSAGAFLYSVRKSLGKYQHIWMWFEAYALSLGAYLGLDTMSERYMYIPSLILCIGIAVMLEEIVKKSTKRIIPILIIIIISGVAMWNIMEVTRLADEWKKASSVVEQSLLKLKQETFPPKEPKTLIFINLPITYGRAWIFPTGMNDAVWHMYRQNPYVVVNLTSIIDAYNYPITIGGGRVVFVFENYEMKLGVKEEK